MKKKVCCEICGAPIPNERLEILPETTTCVKCSETSPYRETDVLGIAVNGGAEIDPMNPEDYESQDDDY